MREHPKKKLTPAEAYLRRDEEQRERLFDLVSSYHFDAVRALHYPSRVAFEKWHGAEQARIEPWPDRPVTTSKSALELAKILNAQKLDRQTSIRWLEANKDQLEAGNISGLADLLMQLVHETRLIAISDSMRAKSDAKRATTTKKLRAVGIRWLELQAGLVDGKKHTKNSAMPLLAEQFHLTERRIREVYLSRIETNLDAYPDGVDAARRKLGLIP